MSEMSPRQKYVRLHAFIKPEQRNFLEQDADGRYPELAAKDRNISPALRDWLDFTTANYSLFLTWIASRSELPPAEK